MIYIVPCYTISYYAILSSTILCLGVSSDGPCDLISHHHLHHHIPTRAITCSLHNAVYTILNEGLLPNPIHYPTLPYPTLHRAILYYTILCYAMLCHAILPYHTIPYSTLLLYSTLLYSTIPYHTILDKIRFYETRLY